MKRLLSAILAIAMIAALAPVTMADDPAVNEYYKARSIYTDASSKYQFRKASTTKGCVNAASGGLITSVALGGEAYQLVVANGPTSDKRNDYLADFTSELSLDGTIPAGLTYYVPTGNLIGTSYLSFEEDANGLCNADDLLKSVSFKLLRSGGGGAPRYWLHYEFKNADELSQSAKDVLGTAGAALTGKMTITYDDENYGFYSDSLTVNFGGNATKLTVKAADDAAVTTKRIEKMFTDGGKYQFNKASATPGAVNASVQLTNIDLGGEFYQMFISENGNKGLDAYNDAVVASGAIPEGLKQYVPSTGNLVGTSALSFSEDSNVDDYIDSLEIKVLKRGGGGAARYWIKYTLKGEADISGDAKTALGTSGAELTGTMTITSDKFVNGSVTVDFSGNTAKLKINAPAARTKDVLSLKGLYSSSNGWRTVTGDVMSKASGSKIEAEAGTAYYVLMGINGNNSTDLKNKTYNDVKDYAPAGNLLDTANLSFSDGFVGKEYLDAVELVYREDPTGNLRWYLKVAFKAADDASLSNQQKLDLVNGVALTGTMTLKHTDATYGFYNESAGYTIELPLSASGTWGLTVKGEVTVIDELRLQCVYEPADGTGMGWRQMGASYMGSAAGAKVEVGAGKTYYTLLGVQKQINTVLNEKTASDLEGYAPAGELLDSSYLSFSDGFIGKEYIKSVTIEPLASNAKGDLRWYLKVEFKAADDASLDATQKAALANGVALTGTMTLKHTDAVKGFYNANGGNTIDLKLGASEKFGMTVKGDTSAVNWYITGVNPTTYRYLPTSTLKVTDYKDTVYGISSSAGTATTTVSLGESLYHMVVANDHSNWNLEDDNKSYADAVNVNGTIPDDIKPWVPEGAVTAADGLSFTGNAGDYIKSVEFKYYMLGTKTSGSSFNPRLWAYITFKSEEELSDAAKQALEANAVKLNGKMIVSHTGTYGFKNGELAFDFDKGSLTVNQINVDPYRVAGFSSTVYCMFNDSMATWTPEGETVSTVSEVSWGDSIYYLAQSVDVKYPVTDGNYVSEFEIVDITGNLLDVIALDEYGNPDIAFIRKPFRGAPDIDKYYLGIRFKDDDGSHNAVTAVSGNIVIKKTGENGFATVDNTITIPVSINILNADTPYTETIARTEENQKVAKFAEIGYGTNKRVQTLVKDKEGNFVRRYLTNTNTAAKETPDKTSVNNSSSDKVSYSGMTYVDYGETVYFMLEDAAGNRVIDGDYLEGIKITPNWINQGQIVDSIEFVMMRYEGGRATDETDYCYFLAVNFVERDYSTRQQVNGEITLSGKGKHGIADTHREYINGQWVDVENKDNEIMVVLDVYVGPLDATMNESNIKLHFFGDRKITDVDTRYDFEDPSYENGGGHADVGTDEEDEIHLWGTQGDCYFTVDTRNQGRLALSNNTDYDEHFGAIYGEDAELQFINGNGATFKKNGIMTISVPEDSYYLYQIKNGIIQEIPELTFDAQECAYKFRTRHLGRYVISSEELNLDKQYYFVNGYYDPNYGLTAEGE